MTHRGIGLRCGTVAFALAAGCALPPAHLATPPPRSAPLAQRYGYYDAHRPRAATITTTLNFMRGGGVYESTSLDALELANGTVVRDPEDLLRAVRMESATGREVAAMRRNRRAAGVAGWVTLGLAAVGAGLITLGAVEPSPVGDGATTTVFVGVGFGVGALIAGAVAGLNYAAGTGRGQLALGAFDRSLRESLNLCENPQGIYDCDAPPPSPPPGPPR